ncbi:hypothetical protein [Amycolatopsis nigrescens]|uniref:hypothetical protein n=1 Tax=Amycolatopsis nigrescens TaxID=381445 RepID=UPI00036A619C|nr:hypothetical protein [Amycolatopsis nigrescens]
MTVRKALILAGSGMVTEVAARLTGDGWLVVLPSKRHTPIAAGEGERPGPLGTLRTLRTPRTLRARGRGGRAIWVEAQWERPRELVRRAGKALGGPADLLVAWVHESYRRSVLGAVEPLLVEGAPVVEVRAGSVGEGEPLLLAHPTQQLVLGDVSDHDVQRALPHAEIVAAILGAAHRAMEGKPPMLHFVGQPRPLVR